MKKELRSGQYAHAPLIYTLAQVMISHVLKMKDHVPDIQDRLRKEGFPKFKESSVQEIVFDPIIGKPPVINNKARWDFFNKDNTQGFSLSENFVVLHTTDYTNFEDFSATLKTALGIVKEIAAPELSERIGLRYIDLIRLKKGESFHQYLQGGLLGFPVEGIATGEVLTRCETVAPTEYGTLVSRTIRYNDGTFLPPEIGVEGLAFDENKKPPNGEMICLLDFDHFSTETREFVVNDLLKVFRKMHDYTGKVFRSAATGYALKTWDPTNNK